MIEMWRRVKAAYQWRRTLSSCRLDPHALPRPITPPEADDFIVAGCSRTGTSLVAAFLFQPPSVVTVMEPWDGLRMEPAELFASLRNEIRQTGRLSRGRLDLDALRNGEVKWQRDGERSFTIEAENRFTLGVKWPTFWQYLDLLPDTRFIITLRNPVEVIASFERVGGRLGQGLDYDVAFNRRLNNELKDATNDPLLRRALLYQHVNSHLLPHLDRDNVLAVRYERWFTEPQRLRDELSEFLGVALDNSPVTIRREHAAESPSTIVNLVREHVPVARDLGYDV